MDKPDKIYVDITETVNNEPSWIDRLTVSHPDSLDDDSCHGNLYLLATPERELASELVEALRDFLEKVTDIRGIDIEGDYAPAQIEKARAVLAKLDKGE